MNKKTFTYTNLELASRCRNRKQEFGGMKMLDKEGFDLWADDYDITVGISDEEKNTLLQGIKKYLELYFKPL